MQIEDQLYPNAICGRDSSLLHAIHEKENSIAIYERDVRALNKDLSQMMEKKITYQTSGNPDEIGIGLNTFFADSLPQCGAVLHDILDLVRLFDKVVRSDSYRLLFTTVNGNMCRKFHTDINDLRLLCTYHGEGTLWVSEDEDTRVIDVELPIDQNQIHQANKGDVLILKGALHPEGNPVLHRSPSIEETEGNRLLLRLDTNNQLEF